MGRRANTDNTYVILRRPVFVPRLEDSLLLLFLAGDAVTRTRHSFQALLLQLLMAGATFAKFFVLDSRQRSFDERKQPAIIVRLAEEEFLGVGIGSLVGEIYRGVFVSLAAFLFGARDGFQKFVAARLQFLFVVVESFLIHSCIPMRAEMAQINQAIVRIRSERVKYLSPPP